MPEHWKEGRLQNRKATIICQDVIRGFPQAGKICRSGGTLQTRKPLKIPMESLQNQEN